MDTTEMQEDGIFKMISIRGLEMLAVMKIQIMIIWVVIAGEDGCSKILRNVGILPYPYTASQPEDRDLMHVHFQKDKTFTGTRT
jgi:hypothetical protein